MIHCEVCLDGVPLTRGRLVSMTQLRYFLHVANSGSFAATARELDVNPSTVRRMVDSLERLVGLQLFRRSPAAIMPTAAGLLLLPLAQRILYLATCMTPRP